MFQRRQRKFRVWKGPPIDTKDDTPRLFRILGARDDFAYSNLTRMEETGYSEQDLELVFSVGEHPSRHWQIRSYGGWLVKINNRMYVCFDLEENLRRRDLYFYEFDTACRMSTVFRLLGTASSDEWFSNQSRFNFQAIHFEDVLGVKDDLHGFNCSNTVDRRGQAVGGGRAMGSYLDMFRISFLTGV